MNGIEPSPAIVGNHFETNKGRAGVLATANLEALTIQLMTPPGIATLGESEVNSTQWSQAYPRREGGRGVNKCKTILSCTIQLNHNHTIAHSYLGFTIKIQCSNQRVICDHCAQLTSAYLAKPCQSSVSNPAIAGRRAFHSLLR